jgi:very-short-patch-repair endonuclease
MDIDRVIAELSRQRHGAIARRDLRARGIDRYAEARRVAAGSLERWSERVMVATAVPHTNEQRVAGATLDVAGGAVASFDTAAWLWGLPGFALRGIEVTAKRTQRRTSSLAYVHRPTRHLAGHVTVVRGIEVTDLPWTIFNLASRHHPKRIARLIDSVGARSPSVLVGLHRLLPKMVGKGMAGCAVMRDLLADRPPGIRLPGSGAQRRFEELMAAAGITGLRREIDLGGHEWIGRVDYTCQRTGVIFEIDSELHHTSPSDVAADQQRDAALVAAGVPEVVRIWTELLWSRPSAAAQIVRSTRSRYLSDVDPHRSGTEKDVG